ncbi:MAG: TlyA family RNA methyltransferase [Clostridia bacterium]|nr:TlyA family RNA methyltransferase [Clostridia bacterium]
MRIDQFLTNNGFFETRTKAVQAIKRQEVYYENKVVDKPSFNVEVEDINKIQIKSPIEFVSLGGYKLQKALIDFNYNVNNLICVDLGASTGGFTDCLIKFGAKKVYAVDVNDTLLHKSLKENSKVIEIIKNAKNLVKEDFEENIDLITADLSFISSKLFLPIMANIISVEKDIILLIKPQFEVGKKIKFKNGIIKDEKLLKNILNETISCCVENGFIPKKITFAPNGKRKNKEFLLLATKTDEKLLNDFTLNIDKLF